MNFQGVLQHRISSYLEERELLQKEVQRLTDRIKKIDCTISSYEQVLLLEKEQAALRLPEFILSSLEAQPLSKEALKSKAEAEGGLVEHNVSLGRSLNLTILNLLRAKRIVPIGNKYFLPDRECPSEAYPS